MLKIGSVFTDILLMLLLVAESNIQNSYKIELMIIEIMLLLTEWLDQCLKMKRIIRLITI